MDQDINEFSKEHRARKSPKTEKPPKQRKPIRPMSKKLSKERETYRRLREEFLKRPENMFCAVYPHLRSCQVHHKMGRIGELLNDTSKWLAVSDAGHRFIEENPAVAKENKWSLPRWKFPKSRIQ